jgi:hypothetical protein
MPEFNEIGRPDRQRRFVNAALQAGSFGAGAMVRRAIGAYAAQGALPARPERRLVTTILRAAHERKSFDVSQTSTLLNGTFQQFLLNPILQGTSALNRTGRQVKVESIRLSVLLTTNAAVNFDVVRFFVVLDKESRGGACQQADILQTNATQTYAINSAYDPDNVPARFKILLDEVVALNTHVSLSSYVGFVKKNVPVNTMVHYYNTTAGTIADIEKGSIYLFVQGLQGTSYSYLAFDSYLTFRDI